MSSRTWIVTATAVGLALVLVIGIGWWLAGGERTGATDLAGPGGGTPPAEPGTGTIGTPDPAADGDEPGGDGGQSGGTGGEGSAGTGGEPIGNRAPEIEDPGLTSDGLLLRIAPTVTDPDGDEVSLLFEVDGVLLDPAATCYDDPLCKGDELPSATPTKGSVRFGPDQVGYRHEAEVTVIAIDDRGAAARETYTHPLAAISTMTLSDVRFRLARPADCFRDVSSRTMAGLIKLTGPVSPGRSFLIELSRSEPSFTVPVGGTGEVVGEAPVQAVRILVEFAGGTAELTKSHRGDTNQGLALYGSTDDCAGHFTYSITTRVR
jgi:hypothetical protein